MGNLGTCANIFRFIFIIFNLIFTLIGLVTIAVGIYLIVTTQTYSFITGDDYVTGAALLIVCGIITTIIAGIGFIGGCFKFRPLLVIYTIAVVVIIILEIVIAILGFVYSDQVEDETRSQYRDGWTRAIQAYRTPDSSDYDESANDAVDFFQENFDCCGIDGPSDWPNLNSQYVNETQNLPASCRCTLGNTGCANITISYNFTGETGSFSDLFWSEGCLNETINFAADVFIIGAGVGLAFGLFEIIVVIVALALVCCITAALKEEYV